MNRLERLINLLATLIDTERPLTREEIAERIEGYPDKDESFRRQFERDKDTLRDMGVPIAVEPLFPHDPGRGSGYRVHKRDYEMPDPGLEPDEVMALHLAATGVQFLEEGARSALQKLGGVVGADAPPSEAGVEVPGTEHLAACYGAIEKRRRLHFSYLGTERTIVPGRLAFRAGHWYLSAWDETREANRAFRLDRIEGQLSTGEPVADDELIERAARSALPGAPWELGDGPEVKARLWVDANQADMAARLAGPAAEIEPQPDGSAVITLQVRNPEGFRNFALGFLEHAVVLSPPELRQDMEQWLGEMAAAS
jgi:proteasome accessory factor B